MPTTSGPWMSRSGLARAPPCRRLERSHLFCTYPLVGRPCQSTTKRRTQMSRLTTVDPAQATGETSELLDATQRTFGVIPNLAKILASSPAALKTWLESIRALAAGQLDPGLRERIALGVAETNGCGYCLSAHTYVAKHVAHPSATEIGVGRWLSCRGPMADG